MRKRSLQIIAVAAAALVLCVGVFGCEPKIVPNGPTSDSDDGTGEIAWSISVDCTVCHAKQGAFHVAGHANAAVVCTDCHKDMTALARVHDGKTASSPMPSRLKMTKMTNEACLSCHGPLDTLAAATASLTVCTDSEGKTVNPHTAVDLTESHRESLRCNDCHSEHEDIDANEVAKTVCVDCHHQDVFTCGTCHS